MKIRVQIILKLGSNWAWCSKQIRTDEKMLRIIVRMCAACGMGVLMVSTLSLRFKYLYWGSFAFPSIWFNCFAHAGSILYLAPNLRQIQTLEKCLKFSWKSRDKHGHCMEVGLVGLASPEFNVWNVSQIIPEKYVACLRADLSNMLQTNLS